MAAYKKLKIFKTARAVIKQCLMCSTPKKTITNPLYPPFNNLINIKLNNKDEKEKFISFFLIQAWLPNQKKSLGD